MRRAVMAAVAAAGLVAALLVGRPAAAAVWVAGYVWSSDPTSASTTPVAGYAYNSTGRGVRIDRSGFGVYAVTFAGMGVQGGIAHVAANGWDTAAYCALAGWGRAGADEVVRVRCFGPGGAPADARFVADFTARNATPAPFMSYFLSTDPVPAAPYVPPAATRFDTFGAPPTVERLGVGEYRVMDDTYDEAGRFDGRVEIVATAYGSSTHCWVADEANEGVPPLGYIVLCTDASGAPADSRFSYTYVEGGDIIGRSPTAYAVGWGRLLTPIPGAVPAEMDYSSSGAPATFEWLDVGLYRLTFPGMGSWGGHALVGWAGRARAHCTTANWGPVAGSLVIIAQCYDSATFRPAEVPLVTVSWTM